jgi:hypothetical protein
MTPTEALVVLAAEKPRADLVEAARDALRSAYAALEQSKPLPEERPPGHKAATLLDVEERASKDPDALSSAPGDRKGA